VISDIILRIPKTISSINDECVSLTLWESFCGVEGPAPFKQVVQELLKLYVYTTVCDPPMIYDPQGVGKKSSFDPESMAPLDDKIKLGKNCYVLCPPLKGADGLLKAKAMVLAADYL